MTIKRIAVYGDSFGTYSLGADIHSQQKGMQYHWSTLIKNKYGCELDNFALSGSSVYYSYKKFIETYKFYDLIIFLITEPSRYIKPLNFSFSKETCVTNQLQIDVWKKTKSNLTEEDLEKLQKLNNWFELSDMEYHYDISELMIESVVQKSDNLVLLPCYEISTKSEFKKKFKLSNNINICSLYYKQMEELKLSDEGMNTHWKENPEYISGHLTPEYNRIAFENIDFYIQNKNWNWIIPVSNLIDNNMKKYYYNKI
jgi:hypothetical protein